LDILQDEKNSPQIKLQAINDILDRVEGKATQKSVIDASVNAERELSPKEIDLIKRQLEKEAKKLK
jgi:divalent metal cation (Fe/Co/Zn/Cd) transporter